MATPLLDSRLRFYDARQKYLLFVTTCNEKWVIARRVALEFRHLAPRPPALRVLDAGMGDATVLTRVLRGLHVTFRHVPFYVLAKEISVEDVRLGLEKMPDRFFEHPPTVLVLTNLRYDEAPWLAARDGRQDRVRWKEVALDGDSAFEFDEQIKALQPTIADCWRMRADPDTGRSAPDAPTVLVLYRADQRFALDEVLPRPDRRRADFDLVVASQAYRARASRRFKVQRVLAPLARSIGPAGRMLVIHSCGGDPGMEIVRAVWPGENPFADGRRELAAALARALATSNPGLQLHPWSDERSVFTFQMHTLPAELPEHIGTSSLLAAWNAATYVAQIEDRRYAEAIADGRYLPATEAALRRHRGLWFKDESFAVSR